MGVDIKEIIKKQSVMRELPKNHRNIFEKRLNKELHTKKESGFFFLKIAASFLILVGISFGGYQFLYNNESETIVQSEPKEDKNINSIADISPDLKKIEDFYLTQINYQISKIKVTDKNKELLEVYLSQLGELQKEYEDLNTKLRDQEGTEKTIDALIDNLQIRLQLLRQLKKKLEIIEKLNSTENENNQA